jgi:hypothetical protein
MSLRTGGRDAVEDTPVTGATEEQIEAAAERWHDRAFDDPQVQWSEQTIETKAYWCAVTHEHAADLVPVGYAIVRAEDALTAEDRAAIGRAIEHIKYDGEYDGFPSDLARLRAIAAGGQE